MREYENFPAAQGVQTEAWALEKVPFKQGWHSVNPAAPEYLPAAQSRQEFPLTASHVPI